MTKACAAVLAMALPLLATAPDVKSSAGITVDEEGVLHSRGATSLRPFDLDKLNFFGSGTHEQAEPPEVGTSFRLHYEYEG